MHVAIVGSNLFEPTHHSLVTLFREVRRHVKSIEVFAKHPIHYDELGSEMPHYLKLPQNGIWHPDADIVHAIGGGETAIKIAKLLRHDIPMIVSFVGGADLTRQLNNPILRSGYEGLFERVAAITYPDRFGLIHLRAAGAPLDKMVCVPAALPLSHYEPYACRAEIQAIMVGRPLGRKNHALAIEVAKQSKMLRQLIIVGRRDSFIEDPRIYQTDIIRHAELIKLLSACNVLLQTGNWHGGEVDFLPTIVLEALAMGIPVISTPLVGIMDLQYKFQTMIKIATTTSDFVHHLDQILACCKSHDSFELRQFIHQTYDHRRIADQIVNLYKEVLQ